MLMSLRFYEPKLKVLELGKRGYITTSKPDWEDEADDVDLYYFDEPAFGD